MSISMIVAAIAGALVGAMFSLLARRGVLDLVLRAILAGVGGLAGGYILALFQFAPGGAYVAPILNGGIGGLVSLFAFFLWDLF